MATVSEKYEIGYERQPAAEPTLGTLATRLVRTTVPRRCETVPGPLPCLACET